MTNKVNSLHFETALYITYKLINDNSIAVTNVFKNLHPVIINSSGGLNISSADKPSADELS